VMEKHLALMMDCSTVELLARLMETN